MIPDDISLKAIPCLSSLDPGHLQQLEKKACIKQISKNGLIFSDSDTVRSFFIVKSGTVKLFKTSEAGRELVIDVMEKGDHFCFAPMFLGSAFTVNAQAMEESEIIMMDGEEFKGILDRETGVLGKKMLSTLCRKVDHLSKMVEDLAFNDIEQRISRSILKLIVSSGQEGGIVTLQVSHRDIASMTGTVREVASRVIRKLKKIDIVVDTGVRSIKVDRIKLITFLEKENLLIKQTNALLYSLPECSKTGHRS